MCIILDTSRLGDFFNKDDFQPLREWVETKKGKIAFSSALSREYGKNRGALQYRKFGYMKLWEYNPQDYDSQIGQLESDDKHIIELALAADIKVLVSNDKKLIRDFERIIGGEVYRTPADEHLLTDDLCP